MYLLYSLNDPITKDVRYIGYTSKTLEERFNSHWYGRNFKKRSHKLNWFKKLEEKGLKPYIKSICTSDSLKEILELEVYYISLYDNLTNSTSGGETNKTYLQDVKDKMKANRKSTKGKDNPMYGRKCPELAERNRNYVWTEEIKDKIRQKQLKNNECPIFRLNHTLAQKTRIRLEVFKEGVSIGIYESKKQACRELKLDSKSINLVLKGEYKQHKGYTFREIYDKT